MSNTEVIQELYEYIQSRVNEASAAGVVDDARVRQIMHEGTMKVVNFTCDMKGLNDETRFLLRKLCEPILM